MWALNESYDSETQVLYLDLVEEPSPVPSHEGLDAPKELGRFASAGDARKFTDVYLSSLAYKTDKVVEEARCGETSKGGCSGPGKPCFLCLDSYHCKVREGR